MRYGFSLLLLVCSASIVRSEDHTPYREKAAALLQLARQHGSPVVHVATTADISRFLDAPPVDEYKTAFLAALEHRTVMIFVGGCNESVRSSFPKAVHVALPAYRGVTDKRLVINKDGTDWYWLQKDISAGAVSELLGVKKSTPVAAPPVYRSVTTEPSCVGGSCSSGRSFGIIGRRR